MRILWMVLLLAVPAAACAGGGDMPGAGDPAEAGLVANLERLDDATERYDRLLRRHVDPPVVDYRAWHASDEDMAQLAAVVDSLEAIRPTVLGDSDALAYWINLYNAVTLELVLEHYPVDSIKDIGGIFTSAWEKERVTVEGRALTLDEIENDIIRPQFAEPRIHFALNCAAVSCPPLSAEAYVGKQLERQLEMATRRALNDPRWVDLSGCGEERGEIRVTKILDWYEEDFGGERGVREFLARYRPDDRALLLEAGCELEYLDYDWSLNAAAGN